jgi:nucleoside-diphosphate-sugar epimerase
MIERKKIVVVGANGNISKEIIPLLVKNYEVHCLTRSVPSFAINSIFLKFIEGDALSA